MSTYTVRASSWSALFDCAMRFEAHNLLGMRLPSSPRALLGTAVHASTAAYDQGRIDNASLTADDTAGIAVDAIRTPKEDVDWSGSDLTKREAERTALILHGMYCQQIGSKTVYRYVELATKPLVIDCGGDVVIELTGTLDRSRVSEAGDGLGIKDLKTGAMAVTDGVAKTKGHAPQIGTYELLLEHTTGLPVTAPGEIIGLKTKGKPEVATGIITGAREVMVGNDASPGLIEHAAQMFRSGLFPPNPSSQLCNPRYCARWATCLFRDR